MSLVGFQLLELGLYQSHTGGRRLIVGAERTRLRGLVDVAEEAGVGVRFTAVWHVVWCHPIGV